VPITQNETIANKQVNKFSFNGASDGSKKHCSNCNDDSTNKTAANVKSKM
jgi:hypothetical protein